MNMLEIAQKILQTASVMRAAKNVVKTWEEGLLVDKEDYFQGGLDISILRDALGGYISEEVMLEVTGDEEE